MRKSKIVFEKDGVETELITDNVLEIDFYLAEGYYPISVEFLEWKPDEPPLPGARNMFQMIFERDGKQIEIITKKDYDAKRVGYFFAIGYNPVVVRLIKKDEGIEIFPPYETTVEECINVLRKWRKGKLTYLKAMKSEVKRDPKLVKYLWEHSFYKKYFDEELTLIYEEWKSKNERIYYE